MILVLFHVIYETLFLDYKEANSDTLPDWIIGSARPSFTAEYSNDINVITSLLHDTIIKSWFDKLCVMQDKEKATLLQNTQRAFFQTASTKEAAEGLATERSLDKTIMDAVISDKIASKTSKSVPRSANLRIWFAVPQSHNLAKQKNPKGGATHNGRVSVKKTNAPKPAKKTQRSLPTAKETPTQPTHPPTLPQTSDKGKNKKTRKKQNKKTGKNKKRGADSSS
jgi:hypothetical protein